MGNIIICSEVERFVPELENKDMLFISYDSNIPPNHSGISIKVSFDEKGEIVYHSTAHEKPDPSTIWVHLPIKYEENVQPLSYFPHYIDLTPGQRYKYLTWLRNIDEPVDIGYVFLYFYGLEKHLILGDIDKAVAQIIRLREHHKNRSFQTYSQNSIIYACFMRNRPDILAKIQGKLDTTEYSNERILLAMKFGFGLSADYMVSVFKKLYKKCSKAAKEDRELFVQITEQVLTEEYGSPLFPLSDIDPSDAVTTRVRRFCNYTFPDDVVFITTPMFDYCKSFAKKVEPIFNKSYELYKAETKAIRQANKIKE